MRNFLKLFILCGIIGAAFLVINSATSYLRLWDGNVYPDPNIEEVQKFARINFPPGSTLVKGKIRRSWNAPGLSAEISMPRANIQQFLKQIPVKRITENDDSLRDYIPSEFDLHLDLTHVRNSASWEGGDIMSTGEYSIFIDLDDSEYARIYMLWQHD